MTPPAKAPTMDAVEAVARALVRSRGGAVTSTDEWWPGAVAHYLEMCAKWPDYQDTRSLVNDAFRDAQAALSAARPFIAAECAKVADDQGNWAIADAIRRAVK